MKTKIFGYKGIVGAQTDLENGVFINQPLAHGQCGCIVSVDELEIDQEAIDLLKQAQVGCDDVTEIMLGKDYICLLGFWLHVIPSPPVITSSCDKTLLDRLVPAKFDINPEFIEYVEELLADEQSKDITN